MLKSYFHNSKLKDENVYEKRPLQFQKIYSKNVVDVNKLLNRVKLKERNETKKKIIFFSLLILLVVFNAAIIVTLK